MSPYHSYHLVLDVPRRPKPLSLPPPPSPLFLSVRGDELSGFNFTVWDSDGPGGCHGNLFDQVKELLLLVINHPCCHRDLGPFQHVVTCNWHWIDVTMLPRHVKQKLTIKHCENYNCACVQGNSYIYLLMYVIYVYAKWVPQNSWNHHWKKDPCMPFTTVELRKWLISGKLTSGHKSLYWKTAERCWSCLHKNRVWVLEQ